MFLCVRLRAGALRVEGDGQLHHGRQSFCKKRFCFSLRSFIHTIHQATVTPSLSHRWQYNQLIFTDLDEWGVKGPKNEDLVETAARESNRKHFKRQQTEEEEEHDERQQLRLQLGGTQ